MTYKKWVLIDSKPACPDCRVFTKISNPNPKEKINYTIDGEIIAADPEEQTMWGREHLETYCPECYIYLFDPEDEFEDD
jgi:hypothetical protein